MEELGTAILDRNYRRTVSDMPGSGSRNNNFVTIVIKVVTVVLALQGMVVSMLFLDLWKMLRSNFATRLVILIGLSGASVSF